MSDRHQAQAYPLRLPDDIKEKVASAAKAAGRSLNAEITARVADSFEPSPEIEDLRRDAGLLKRVLQDSHQAMDFYRRQQGVSDAEIGLMVSLVKSILRKLPDDLQQDPEVSFARELSEAIADSDSVRIALCMLRAEGQTPTIRDEMRKALEEMSTGETKAPLAGGIAVSDELRNRASAALDALGFDPYLAIPNAVPDDGGDKSPLVSRMVIPSSGARATTVPKKKA